MKYDAFLVENQRPGKGKGSMRRWDVEGGLGGSPPHTLRTTLTACTMWYVHHVHGMCVVVSWWLARYCNAFDENWPSNKGNEEGKNQMVKGGWGGFPPHTLQTIPSIHSIQHLKHNGWGDVGVVMDSLRAGHHCMTKTGSP